MPTVCATSDLHGHLPTDVPACDLLLIAGDICPDLHVSGQRDWLDGPFRVWLHTLLTEGVKNIVAIAGNHDFIFERGEHTINALYLPWTYLRDSETVVEGLRIYGIPWVPNLQSWAFYGSKKSLHERYLAIPKGTDIVLSHGPPRGYGDKTKPNLYHPQGDDVGAKSAVDMMDRIKPKVLVCGHIHEGFGHYTHEHKGHTVDIYNVSFVDELYVPRDQIIEIMVDDAQQEQKESDPAVSEVYSSSTST